MYISFLIWMLMNFCDAMLIDVCYFRECIKILFQKFLTNYVTWITVLICLICEADWNYWYSGVSTRYLVFNPASSYKISPLISKYPFYNRFSKWYIFPLFGKMSMSLGEPRRKFSLLAEKCFVKRAKLWIGCLV